MNKVIIKYIITPFGEMILGSCNNQLCLSDWKYRKKRKEINKRIQQGLGAYFEEGNTEIIDQAEKQLNEYFNKEREEFSLPLSFVGSDFQKQVWEELLSIKYGQTVSYLGLSGRLGDEKAIRAVAAANGANALSIFVPCHRIVGSKGELTGYAGGIDVKRKLLQLESGIEQVQLDLF